MTTSAYPVRKREARLVNEQETHTVWALFRSQSKSIITITLTAVFSAQLTTIPAKDRAGRRRKRSQSIKTVFLHFHLRTMTQKIPLIATCQKLSERSTMVA